MEIHPPEHPIRSFRDFAVQIFTVTCGIIIALGLEALVVHRHEARLLRETRADFSAEITDSIAKLQDAHTEADSDAKWMLDIMGWGNARLKHTAGDPPKFLQRRSFEVLPTSAWATAQAAQVLPLMRFSELRALAKAYAGAVAFNDMSIHAREQWIGLARYGDLVSLSDDDVRAGMGDMRLNYAYTVSLAALEATLIEEYKAASREVRKAE